MVDARAQMWIILFITTISTAIGIEEDNSMSNLIPCKEGWYPFGEKCYKSFGQKTPLSWFKAAESCINKGGHLATIETQELQDFLTSYLVLNEQQQYMWSGLTIKPADESQLLKTDSRFKQNDQKVDITYVWHDGSIVNYTNWDQGSPYIPRGVDWVECVFLAVVAHDKPGKWNTYHSCSYEMPYICQTNKSEEANSSDPRFCPPEEGGGWKYLDSCYYIVTTEDKSWDDAEKYCIQNLNGHLFSILNNKNTIFLNYLLSSADSDFWIGVKMRDRELQMWSSGWHAVFNKWDDDQEFTKGKCGLRTKYGHWISVDCVEKHPFVCEVYSKKPPVYEQGRERWKCPDSSKDWKDLGGDTCYIFETQQSLGWYDANYACMTKGGGLVSIHSEVESEILHHHVMNTQGTLLIGLHRKLENKTVFQWIDGSVVNFDNWHHDEPSSIHEECGELWTVSMLWNDVSCDQKKGYICSAKKVPPILYDENYEEPLSKYDIHTERCDCPGNITEPLLQHRIKAEESDRPGDITAKTVVITMVCSFSVMILIGIMVYFYKTRSSKHIQFSRLHNVAFNRP